AGSADCGGRILAIATWDDVPALPPRSESAEYSDGNHDRPSARRLRAPGDRLARAVAFGAARRLRWLRGCRVRDDPHAAPARSARRILSRIWFILDDHQQTRRPTVCRPINGRK